MLLSELISEKADAKVIVSFGVNPQRRHDFLMHLKELDDIIVYASIVEEEGMSLLRKLKKVDMVVIGTMYPQAGRDRIKAYVNAHLPQTKLIQPGIDFPADLDELKKRIVAYAKL